MKRQFKAALALAAVQAVLLPAVASAQQVGPTPVMAPGSTLLTLTGEGRAERAPDIAQFNAGVSSTGPNAAAALAANAADMNRVIAALKRAGIADKDIQTSNLSLNPVYAPQRRLPDGTVEPEQPRIIGYQVSNTVNVRQRRLADYGKVIDTLVTAGANQVNGPSFEIDKPDAALAEARTAALAKARATANLYAAAAGMRVVRILTIAESGGYAPQPMFRQYAMAAGAPPPPPPPSPVMPGEVSLAMNVTVQFELAP